PIRGPLPGRRDHRADRPEPYHALNSASRSRESNPILVCSFFKPAGTTGATDCLAGIAGSADFRTGAACAWLGAAGVAVAPRAEGWARALARALALGRALAARAFGVVSLLRQFCRSLKIDCVIRVAQFVLVDVPLPAT